MFRASEFSAGRKPHAKRVQCSCLRFLSLVAASRLALLEQCTIDSIKHSSVNRVPLLRFIRRIRKSELRELLLEAERVSCTSERNVLSDAEA